MSSTAAYHILEKHVPAYMLKGYINGLAEEQTGRLYAFTLVDIDPETFENYYADWGHSAMWFDDEKTKIYLENGCFQYKDSTQCAREGIYKRFSLKFYGSYFENRWYIQKELTYFGELTGQDKLVEFLTEGIESGVVLKRSVYEPIDGYYPQWNPAEPPMSRGVEYDEFAGMPELVAGIKQEEKLALLRAHSQFLYLDVFAPMLAQLRVAQFDEFSEYYELYPMGSSLVFANQRKLALLPLMVMNNKQEYRICYFLWHSEEGKIYQWQYFHSPVYDFSFHYPEEIISDLSKISYWNHTAYLYSSCTLDDDNFWCNYVLFKDNGQYKYLSELKY